MTLGWSIHLLPTLLVVYLPNLHTQLLVVFENHSTNLHTDYRLLNETHTFLESLTLFGSGGGGPNFS